MADLALGDQIGQRADGLLDRSLLLDARHPAAGERHNEGNMAIIDR